MNSKNTTMEDKTEPLMYEAPEIRELLTGLAYGDDDPTKIASNKYGVDFGADGEGEENDTFDLDY